MTDRVRDAEHVPGAAVDFRAMEVLVFLALLAFSNAPSGADRADRASLTPAPAK